MCLIIHRNPTYCLMEGTLPEHVGSRLREELSYEPENSKHVKRAVKARYPGANVQTRVHLFSRTTGSPGVFMTGLLPRVTALLKYFNTPFTIEQHDVGDLAELREDSSDIPWDWNEGFALRPYQTRQVEGVLREQRGIIQSCTGSGKTIAIAASIKETGVTPALVVVHSSVLLHQTRDRLEEALKMPIGLLGRVGSKAVRDFQPVTVATSQTLTSMLSGDEARDATYFLENLKALHIDEAHHMRADTIKQISNLAKTAPFRVGWSGTPFREQGDDLEIEGALGQVIDTYTYSDAIRDNFIVRPHIYTFKFTPPFYYNGYEYNDIIADYIEDNPVRDRSICDLVEMLQENNEKILVLVGRVKHGENLSRMLPGSQFVQGSSHKKYRDGVLEGLRGGEHVVVATPLLDEGVDIPEATALVLAHPNRSLVKTYQRMGRVLRRAPGKERAIIVDIQDQVAMLDKQAKRRMSLYSREPEFVIKDRSQDGKNWYVGD